MDTVTEEAQCIVGLGWQGAAGHAQMPCHLGQCSVHCSLIGQERNDSLCLEAAGDNYNRWHLSWGVVGKLSTPKEVAWLPVPLGLSL